MSGPQKASEVASSLVIACRVVRCKNIVYVYCGRSLKWVPLDNIRCSMPFLRERIGSWTTSDEDNVTAACRSAIKGSDIPTVTILESFCINGDRYTAVTKVNERCRVTELKKHILFKGNTQMPGAVFRSVSMQSMITTIPHEILNCPELNILHEICLGSLLTLLWFLGNALMYRPNKEGKVLAIQGASNTGKSTLVGICNQLLGTVSTTGPPELVTSD